LATDPHRGVIWGIDLGGFPNAPVELDQIDATGHVASARTLSYQGQVVSLAEGLAFAPDGRLWVTFHVDELNGFVSGHLGVLDPATGVIDPTTVVVLTHGTQNDGDAIEFVGHTLYLADTSLTISTILFTVDLRTGVLTQVGKIADAGGAIYEVTDMAWDGHR